MVKKEKIYLIQQNIKSNPGIDFFLKKNQNYYSNNLKAAQREGGNCPDIDLRVLSKA